MKKPSAAKPPDGTVFFIDRSLGQEPIRSELVKQGLTVEIHDDHFSRDEADRVWLEAVGSRGWVVLTKDQHVRYRPLEKAALVSSGARVFILIAGNLRGAEIATVFVSSLPRVFEILHSRPGPFVARISKSAHVKVWAPSK